MLTDAPPGPYAFVSCYSTTLRTIYEVLVSVAA